MGVFYFMSKRRSHTLTCRHRSGLDGLLATTYRSNHFNTCVFTDYIRGMLATRDDFLVDCDSDSLPVETDLFEKTRNRGAGLECGGLPIECNGDHEFPKAVRF